jgi:hypothetical protein
MDLKNPFPNPRDEKVLSIDTTTWERLDIFPKTCVGMNCPNLTFSNLCRINWSAWRKNVIGRSEFQWVEGQQLEALKPGIVGSFRKMDPQKFSRCTQLDSSVPTCSSVATERPFSGHTGGSFRRLSSTTEQRLRRSFKRSVSDLHAAFKSRPSSPDEQDRKLKCGPEIIEEDSIGSSKQIGHGNDCALEFQLKRDSIDIMVNAALKDAIAVAPQNLTKAQINTLKKTTISSLAKALSGNSVFSAQQVPCWIPRVFPGADDSAPTTPITETESNTLSDIHPALTAFPDLESVDNILHSISRLQCFSEGHDAGGMRLMLDGTHPEGEHSKIRLSGPGLSTIFPLNPQNANVITSFDATRRPLHLLG